jgi:hypothetical protein
MLHRRLHRRSFLLGVGSLSVVAPAIVRATSLMPIKALMPIETFDLFSIAINSRGACRWTGYPNKSGYCIVNNGDVLVMLEYCGTPTNADWSATLQISQKYDGSLVLSKDLEGTFRRPDGTEYSLVNNQISECDAA